MKNYSVSYWHEANSYDTGNNADGALSVKAKSDSKAEDKAETILKNKGITAQLIYATEIK